MIDLGSVYQVAVDVVDASGAPANPDTATLTITLPDDSTVTPAVPAPTTAGQLRVNYTTTQAGRHLWRMVTTNPITAYTEVFDVRDQGPVAIVSLADAKKQLNIASTDTGDDDELRGFITGASLAVERELGRIVARRSFTERRSTDGDGQVLLSNVPVLALTSAVGADGRPLTGDVDVTYTAGLRIVPADSPLATLIVVQHLWETQRGRYGSVPGGSQEPEYMTGRGFALPRRALELLDTTLPGVA